MCACMKLKACVGKADMTHENSIFIAIIMCMIADAIQSETKQSIYRLITAAYIINHVDYCRCLSFH